MNTVDRVFDEVVLRNCYTFGVWQNKIHPSITQVSNALFSKLWHLCDDALCLILQYLPFTYWDTFIQRMCSKIMWMAVRNYRRLMEHRRDVITVMRKERPLFVFDFELAHDQNKWNQDKPCHTVLKRIKRASLWRYAKVALYFRGHFIQCCGGMMCRIINALKIHASDVDILLVIEHLSATHNTNLKKAIAGFHGCVRHRGVGLEWWE